MHDGFDQHGINHATVALRLEMSPAPLKRRNDGEGETLFFGGTRPTDADRERLAEFALRKNWKLVFASFDPADAAIGPTGFDVVATDGESRSIALIGGRLWSATGGPRPCCCSRTRARWWGSARRGAFSSAR